MNVKKHSCPYLSSSFYNATQSQLNFNYMVQDVPQTKHAQMSLRALQCTRLRRDGLQELLHLVHLQLHRVVRQHVALLVFGLVHLCEGGDVIKEHSWIGQSSLALTFLRLGLSLREFTPPRSSPTMMIGSLWLKLTWVSLARFTTFCSHSGSCLFSARSNTCTCEG